MPYLYSKLLRPVTLLLAGFAAPCFLTAQIATLQTPTDQTHPSSNPTVPNATTRGKSLKASAYYHFTMGHLYEDLAGAYGNRSDYVNKAIDNYRLAMKEDPTASFLVEDIAELYRMSGRIREAVEEAQTALKANPDDLNARRVLARIYTQQIGDAQTNHVDEGMARRAIEQYKLISDKDPKDLDSLVMLGRLQKLVGSSPDAEAAYKKVLASDPDNEDAITGLANVYSDLGDPKRASELLQKLTSKSPTPRSLMLLAASYEQMHQYDLAAETYTKAIDLDPNRAELRAALAQDQVLAGKLDDALKTYQDLAESNPQEPQPYLGMAQIYREKKNFAKAHESLDKAKSLDPDNLDIRYNEVLLLAEEGKTADAIAAQKNIVDAMAKRGNGLPASTRSDMIEKLGALYRANGQYQQAVDTFRQIATGNPDAEPRAQAEIADTYRAAKEFPKAQQEADAALKKYPKDRTLMRVQAEIFADEGKTDDATAQLRKLLDGKNDLEIQLEIAQVYEKGKNYTEMGKTLDAADKLSPDKENQATIAFLRGSMYEREKKYELAEKQFRTVLDADPNNASALNYLGYMLADEGVRLPEAQELIKHAVNIEPDNYAFLDSLGWVYFRQNRLDDAEQQLKRSLDLLTSQQAKGTDPTIHDHLGDVYFREGKLREAIAQWQTSLKAWNESAPAELEPEEVTKVQKKLDGARVKLAQEHVPMPNDQ